MNCIFCKIRNKEIQAKLVYEDDKVIAFLDNNPNTNGHTLIIPKQHFKDLYDININVLTRIHKVARILMNHYNKTLMPTGYTLAQNNGSAGEVKHYHLHLIPRYDNDLLDHIYNKGAISRLDDVVSNIKKVELIYE